MLFGILEDRGRYKQLCARELRETNYQVEIESHKFQIHSQYVVNVRGRHKLPLKGKRRTGHSCKSIDS